MIRHIVALRFRNDIDPLTRERLFSELRSLQGHIAGIQDFRTFTNVSPETDLVRGFTDVFWFDFRDAQVRDDYLADEEHRAIGARIVTELEGGADGVFVIDLEI